MKTTKKEIIIRLLNQVYNYADEIIHLKSVIKDCQKEIEELKSKINYN